MATTDPTAILKIIQREGIHVLPNFLGAAEVEAIASEGRRLARERPDFGRHMAWQGDDSSFTVNLVPSRLTRQGGWTYVPSYQRIKSLPVVKNVAEAYLGPGWGTSNFIYNYTKGPVTDELFPLHFDNADGQKCFKVYVYLNEGSRENGAFRYIPRSHRLSHAVLPKIYSAIAGGAISADKATDVHINSLLKAVDDYLDLSGDTELLECVALLRDLAENPDRSYDYVVNGGPGTVVLFDTNGVHGGGVVNSGERYIARYHFVDSEYVARNLPDQLPPLKRAFWHARRLTRKLAGPPSHMRPAA